MSKHDGDQDRGGAPLSGENYDSYPTSGDPIGYDLAKGLDAEPFDEGEWESAGYGGESGG